jgi:hypothetical protein
MRENDTSGDGPRAHSLNDLGKRGLGKRSFFYKEINEGRLRAIKIGALTKVLDDDLRAWLASKPAYQRPNGKTKRRRRRQREAHTS